MKLRLIVMSPRILQRSVTFSGLILIIIISFINYSCFSYYEISQEELKKKEPDDFVKIEMKNQTELKVKVKNINVSIQDSIVTILRATGNKIIKVSEIDRISEPKFNILLTVLSIGGIIAGALVFLILLMLITGGLQVGG